MEVSRRGFLLGAIAVPVGMALPRQAVEELIRNGRSGAVAAVPSLEQQPKPDPARGLLEAFAGDYELVLFDHTGKVLGRFRLTSIEARCEANVMNLETLDGMQRSIGLGASMRSIDISMMELGPA